MDPSALDPALSGAIDPALSGAGGDSSSAAIDPALSGVLDPSLSSSSTTTTTTGAIDPSLFPAPLAHSHDPSVAAAYEVALGMQDPLPLAVAETDTPEERLKKLRSDYRAAAVSHWATLFLHHAGEEFDVEAFEKDLINTTPGADDQFLPHFLGRILNTLANDRNTNHTNWLNALRRSYNRRVSTREENPFYTWVRVPASVVEREKEEEREREEREYEEEMAKRGGAGVGGEGAGEGKIKWEGEEERLREAERALGRKNRPKTEDAEAKPAVVHEAGAADVNMAVPSAEAAVPVTEEALDDGFNAELADVIGAEGVKEEEGVKGEGEGEEGEDEWYEEQRAVEWGTLGLETKLDAIYNVCEWHMVDPERQFRKYLQWDGESAWHRQRLDPLGVDSLGNKYYHLADDRLWVQRAPPQPNPLQPSAVGEEGLQAGQVAGKKPKTLLGLRAGPRDKSKKGTVTGTVRVKLKRDALSGRYLQVDEDSPAVAPLDLPAEGEEGEGEGEFKRSTTIEEDVEMPVWEREYWEERARAENTPGFVEWEALCITMDDWRAFPARFAGSTNPDEAALVRKIEEEVIPGIEEDQARREEEAAARAAKRAALLASQETAAEEEARITAERLAHAERFSRSTRGVRTNYSEDSFGVAAAQHASSAPMAAGGSNAGSAPPPPPQESREERLKKREEEKRRAEEEEAARQAQEAWEVQREEARVANGGVLPVEYMNEEEREEYERGVEKERKKREAEERKRASEEKKKARAKERRAELKAERDAIAREEAEAEEAAAAQAAAAAARAHAQAQAQAAALAAVPPEAAAADDPWWMDCEICGLCGWNVDDGQELICCDECEEWQHLPCHVLADQQLGRPPQPFHDEDYKWACGRCQGLVPRTGRPPLPNPPNAPLQCVSAVTQVAQAGGKRRASDQNGRAAKGAKMPAAKKPKVAKQANGAQQSSIPYGHGAHPLYHPSAYSHPAAAMHTASASPGAQPAQQVAPSPPPQQQQAQPNEPMSYEQLKAMVESNPALLSQLPAEYQQHFSQLLGIPLS